MGKLNYFLVVVMVAFGVASAMTDDEIKALKEAFKPMIDSCAEKFAITKDAKAVFMETGNVDALDPCYFACAFKKSGVLNDEGFFDFVKATEKKQVFFSAAEDKELIATLSKRCAFVNEQNVSDGAEGCMRSKLLIECYVKENAKFLPLLSQD